MKILLIAPASGNWKSIGKKKLFNGKTFRFSMLALLTVAKLCPDDAEVRIVDEQIEDIPLDEDFDIVGITCMTAAAPRAYEISTSFRSRGIPVVLGGYHPSLNVSEASEHADAVVVGPAMEAWEKLLADFNAGSMQKIYYGNPAVKPPRVLPRELISSAQYATANAIYATSGCTNKCRFCSISAFYGAKQYHRPADEVAFEIASFNKKFFMFIDDNLTQDKEYAKKLFQKLLPLKKRWITQASIEISDDDEFLSLMAKAGCVGVFVGLESFNDKVLDKFDKQINTPSRYAHAVKKFHLHGIFVEAGIIFGFDEDDTAVFNSTFSMLENIGIDAIQVAILTPQPGTPLFETMRSRITDTNWEHYDYRHVVFSPERMTSAQLQAGADWVISSFYKPWRILKRLFRWICTPGGLRNFVYPLVLNFAYYGRTGQFKIKGYNPAKMLTISYQSVPLLKTNVAHAT